MDRLPPQNIDAEESIIGALLSGEAVESIDLLTPDDFYKTAHQTIFRVALKINSEKNNIDVLTVKDALGDDLERIGGVAYLSALMDAPYPINLEHVVGNLEFLKVRILSSGEDEE